MRTNLYIVFIFLILLGISGAKGQNVETIGEEDPFKFTGSLSAQFLAYQTSRENPSRDPFVWTLSGSPTISLYGFTIPMNFVISQKQQTFRQPFNQFGMSPYYKWIKLHAGYRNIFFSRYTLANHTFLGGGIEATPGNFRLGFIYGRFLKAVENDSLNLEFVTPSFRRKGYSFKVGYGTDSNYLDLILFNGKDDTTSIDRPDLSAGILPGENLVLGIKSFNRLFQRVTLDIDFGYSIYTRNLYADDEGITDFPLKSLITAFMHVNNSTQVNWAGNATANYVTKFFGLRLQYQRIQPEYETMGAYFFINDLEQITVEPSLFLLNRKMNIRGSIGYQRNNLFDNKVNDTFRKINSLNVSYSPDQHVSMQFSYMNYRLDQSRNPLFIKDFVDSLQMKQISHNLTGNVNYSFGDKDLRHTLTGGLSYQQFNDDNSFTEVRNYSQSYSPYFSYRLTNSPAKFSVYGRLNYNRFETATTEQTRIGFSAGANKRLNEDKLLLSVSASFLQNSRDGEHNGTTAMVRGNTRYRLFKNHNVNFSLNYVNRSFTSDTGNNFNEFLIRFGYTLRI